MAMPSSEIISWERALHNYIHIYAFIHVKGSFLKDNNQTWHWHCKAIYFGMALKAFWKSALHVCLHPHKAIYIHTLPDMTLDIAKDVKLHQSTITHLWLHGMPPPVSGTFTGSVLSANVCRNLNQGGDVMVTVL